MDKPDHASQFRGGHMDKRPNSPKSRPTNAKYAHRKGLRKYGVPDGKQLDTDIPTWAALLFALISIAMLVLMVIMLD
jgi:hypothetical protein